VFNRKTRRYLKGQLTSKGYLTIWFGPSNNPYLHDLVAETYIGPKPKGLIIDHVDGNRLNNAPKNLEYVTYSENTKRGIKLNKIKKALSKSRKVGT
jgi:hypothetical protein